MNNEPEMNKFAPDQETEIIYRHWQANSEVKRVCVLLHRGHEHSGRVVHLAEALHDDQTSVFAWDARGHGLSSGKRGFAKNFGELVSDFDKFIQHITQEYGVAVNDISVVAQSVGAVIAATWVHDYAPKIRSLVLASPALRVKLYVPLAIPSLRLANHFGVMQTVQSYVKSKLLTHDTERQKSYDSDALITQQIATNILIGLYDAATRLIEDGAAITVPTMLLTSGTDWVVRKDAQRKFFETLGSNDKEMYELDGFYHDTYGELNADQPIELTKTFLDKHFELESNYSPNINYTQQEFYMLSASTNLIKSMVFSATKLLMFSLGRISDGIDVGVRTGFDSGAMLDYVYHNQAKGKYGVGPLLDRVYLDSPGWKGIRVRGEHIQQSLCRVVDDLKKDDKTNNIKLVEIATGQGHYMLNGLAQANALDADVLLRDFDSDNVAAVAQRAQEQGFTNCNVLQGDAFDESSMGEIPEQRNIGVVSGLYELFADNDLVAKSLKLLADKISEGGYLIYTGQPYHPQLEFIARVLTSHRGGQDWVMRRRTQAELDALVTQAGFEKIDMLIDEWGIFTVSIARKIS